MSRLPWTAHTATARSSLAPQWRLISSPGFGFPDITEGKAISGANALEGADEELLGGASAATGEGEFATSPARPGPGISCTVMQRAAVTCGRGLWVRRRSPRDGRKARSCRRSRISRPIPRSSASRSPVRLALSSRRAVSPCATPLLGSGTDSAFESSSSSLPASDGRSLGCERRLYFARAGPKPHTPADHGASFAVLEHCGQAATETEGRLRHMGQHAPHS
jgi:hypothetical protein